MIERFPSVVLAGALVASCGTATETVTIEFVPIYGDKEIDCDGNAEVRLTDLRLYLANIQLRDTQGNPVAIILDEGGAWQQPDLVLLDFEDGQGSCSNGTAGTNTGLTGKVPAGTYEGLEFTVGVPFDRNHSDPLTASPPLGDAAMHWHWRGGYKFLRAGVATNHDSYWLHLGSTGCEGAIGSIVGCKAPNRVTALLEGFRADRDTVIIDLSQLIPLSELEDGVVGSCSSGPAEQGCDGAFAALGLSHRGQRSEASQTVFRAGRRP